MELWFLSWCGSAGILMALSTLLLQLPFTKRIAGGALGKNEWALNMRYGNARFDSHQHDIVLNHCRLVKMASHPFRASPAEMDPRHPLLALSWATVLTRIVADFDVSSMSLSNTRICDKHRVSLHAQGQRVSFARGQNVPSLVAFKRRNHGSKNNQITTEL